MLYHSPSPLHNAFEPGSCLGCTLDESKHGKPVEVFIDCCGNCLSKEMVISKLRRATGAPENTLDHIQVGEVYSQDGLWWRRIE
jgi:hypothetical protein